MLTLRDLHLGLANLLKARHAALTHSKSGQFFEEPIREIYRKIDELPAALTSLPLTVELANADLRHDGYGTFIYYLVKAYATYPDATPELLTAAKKITDAFIPKLAELKDAYRTEAERAVARQPLLAQYKADLQEFPVTEAKTLYDVANAFVQAGIGIDGLLSQRGDESGADRSEAAALRSEAVGTINRFREELQREIKRNTSLPRDLESQVFAYFDTLESMQPAKKAVAKAPPPATPATPTNS